MMKFTCDQFIMYRKKSESFTLVWIYFSNHFLLLLLLVLLIQTWMTHWSDFDFCQKFEVVSPNVCVCVCIQKNASSMRNYISRTHWPKVDRQKNDDVIDRFVFRVRINKSASGVWNSLITALEIIHLTHSI